MKLTRRTTLFYREGTSDKVYEVDLCESAPERYVVNYRYGRRGATLKEGVETPQALPLAAAEKAFDRLISSKVKKGYSETAPDAPTGPIRPRQKPQDPAARDRKLLTRLGAQTSADIASQLSQFVRSILQPGEAERWPLERVIWRAGELKLKAAAPLLVRLLGSGNALRDYCLIWALGWCGDQSVIPVIEQWSSDARTGDAVRHIAREAILKLAGESLSRQLRAIQFDRLPEALRDVACYGPAEVFEAALATLSDQERFNILETLYTIDNAHVRPALLATLRTAPLAFGSFQALRQIFKAAEYRRDGEVFGLLARRFEKERAIYKKPQGSWQRIAVSGQLLGRDDLKRYLESGNRSLAYSSNTRIYLRRRVWRTLERLGNLGDLDYLALASGVLLAYTDADAAEPRTSEVYDWRRRSRVVKARWDAYAPYLSFNHVLYTHSPRYLLKPNNKAWRCRGRYQPGDPEPKVREEAFPKLWQERPAVLIDLLIKSACLPVHAFAVKALAACPDYCAGLDVATILALLGKSYETTVRFAFALAQDRYRPENPDLDLVLALSGCGLGEARLTSHRWIDEGRNYFLRDSQFLAGLVASPYPDTRTFARRLLASSLLTGEVLQSLLGRLVARLLMTTEPDLAHDIAQTLGERFEGELRALGLPVILDLLDHPLLAVQQLGARLLLGYEPEQIPTSTILALLNSEHESVRGIGVRLFGQLPQKALLEREELLIALATHPHADLRNAIRPVLRGLAGVYPALAARLCATFIEFVLMREADDGLRSHLVRLLAEDIPDWSAELSLETAWKLLKNCSSAAQELGGLALARHSEWVDEFTTAQIVELANHPVLSIRAAARSMFLQVLSARRGQPGELTVAARLLDARWEDTRAFGHEVFTVHLQAEDLTAAVLVNLCDSVRPEARAFGRELITRHFKSEDGEQYLLRLSEHPEADLQLFATNYLDDAADNPERLRALMPYFVRVLSAVNRGRVAKSRLWAFLEVEALKSEAAARVVAEIMERQSITLAAGDRARTIELMLAIHRRYPTIALPIHLQPTQLRT